MPEPSDQPAKPLCTWRPMALWTAGILLTLGLTWFVGAVVVPVWQVRSALQECKTKTGVITRLGGPASAARKLAFYARLPEHWAPEQELVADVAPACAPEGVPVFIDLLGSSRARARAIAAQALGRTKDRRAVDPLIAALSDGDAVVRRVAAGALGNVGDPRAFGPLTSALEDADGGVREIAGLALGKLEDRYAVKWPRSVAEAVARLLAGMSDSDKRSVRNAKKEALAAYHHGWGTAIRNNFGLWNGNKELLADCQTDDPDRASGVIIEAVWEALQ